MSSQGFKKGLLIKIFCTGVPPCLQRGDYQGAISSYQGTIKQVWVSAERNFISDLNQFQMMANAGKVNLYHMTKFQISIDSLSSCARQFYPQELISALFICLISIRAIINQNLTFAVFPLNGTLTLSALLGCCLRADVSYFLVAMRRLHADYWGGAFQSNILEAVYMPV